MAVGASLAFSAGCSSFLFALLLLVTGELSIQEVETSHFSLRFYFCFVQVWDIASPKQLSSFAEQHGRSSFFRGSGAGVQQLLLRSGSRQLFSCGADGMVKWRTLPEF